MKIAFISYEYPPDSCNGGIATYVGQAVQMLSRRGHEVEVFASSNIRNGQHRDNGVWVHWIKAANRTEFGDIVGPVFAARHAEKPFDVLEGPEYKADARKAIELVPDIPLVVKMHTPTLMVAQLNSTKGPKVFLRNLLREIRDQVRSQLSGKPKRTFSLMQPAIRKGLEMEALESAHARKAAIVVPPCQDLFDFAQSDWGIPSEAIRLAPYTYDPSEDFLKLEPRTTGSVVGFVGRLEKRKGIETLAEAMPEVLNAVPEARFRIVGSASKHVSGLPYDSWLKRRLSRYADRVEFAGKIPLDEMAAVYDSLDICVFPSLWENFPFVCLEAMSAGRAIIASSAGGMKEMLDQGRVGRLFSPGDANALARELVALLQAPKDRVNLGKLARERVLLKYNSNVIGKMMEKVYEEAIDRGPPENIRA